MRPQHDQFLAPPAAQRELPAAFVVTAAVGGTQWLGFHCVVDVEQQSAECMCGGNAAKDGRHCHGS